MVFEPQIDGYRPFKKQKYAHSTKRGNKEGFTRAKVATIVAQVMKDFIEEVISHTTWRVALTDTLSNIEDARAEQRTPAFREST